MFLKFISFLFLFVFTIIGDAFNSNAMAQPEFCWKDSYGRGAGTIPDISKMPKGQYRHWFSANYYSCPKGFKRSLNPNITASDACIKKVINKKPRGSFYDPRKGGQNWSCNGWKRTGYAVTSNRACSKAGYEKVKKAQFKIKYKKNKPSGSFYDPRGGGEYWSCGGWKRTWSAVTASDACVSGGWFSKTKKATYKGKAHNSKPSGSFYDPRSGGQYWSCNGWKRTGNAVTSNRACSKAFPESLRSAAFKGQYQKITKKYATKQGSVCGGKQEQAGLCYNSCKKGYDAVGPVCWGQKAPAKNWVSCGAGFARTKTICGMVIGAQVMAAVEVASFVATAGASSTASGAKKAAAKSTEKAQKAAKWAAANKNKAKMLTALKKAKAAGETVAAYDGAYKSLSNATTEEDVVRAAAEIASLADPTGVSSAVAAYTFPVCAKYKSKGAFDKKTNLSPLQIAAKSVTGSKKETPTSTNGKVNKKATKSSGKINVPWKRIKGGLVDIGVGANGVVWGVNGNGAIYRLRSNNTWENIKGGLVRIDVDNKGNAYGVNKSGQIYRWNGKKWNRIAGGLTDIGVGANGAVWGVNSNQDIYRLKSNDKWQKMSGKAVRIDVDPNGNAVVVNKSGHIYQYNGKGGWKRIAGVLSDISVGPEGKIWGINKNGAIYKYNGKGGWIRANGSATKAISVGPKGPWVINKNGQIYKGSK